MTTPPLGVERRVGQRFAYNLPLSFRDGSSATEGLGFTQDLSSRGVFFFTDIPLREASEIELTLRMPSEITLGENMRVRCRGRILRIAQADLQSADLQSADLRSDPATGPPTLRPMETKIGVAVCLTGYEYLSQEDDGPAEFRRISALHSHAPVSPPASSHSSGPRSLIR